VADGQSLYQLMLSHFGLMKLEGFTKVFMVEHFPLRQAEYSFLFSLKMEQHISRTLEPISNSRKWPVGLLKFQKL
jgi:hypothetical protein